MPLSTGSPCLNFDPYFLLISSDLAQFYYVAEFYFLFGAILGRFSSFPSYIEASSFLSLQNTKR